MATRRISVNVGGLWRTSVELKKKAIWKKLKEKIEEVTGIWIDCQKLEPNGENNKRCELEEGDDVFCDWKLLRGKHPLHCAAKEGNVEAIRSWLASGADINAIDEYGRTPLTYASNNLRDECIMELLRLGCNANMIDYYGKTALHYIANICLDLKKKETTMKLLIKTGCDPTIQNRNGETFIDILKKRECHELATRLEEWIKEK